MTALMKNAYPYYLGGKPVFANESLVVKDKFSQADAVRVALADDSAMDRAAALAVKAAPEMKRLAGYERRAILSRCVEQCEAREGELAEILTVEAGKPLKDSRAEVSRLIDTFRVAAEECARQTGEVVPLDISPRAKGYLGMWRRVPVGPCAFISPFNFPLNLVAHKIAPAIASGCPFVLKPASATPVSALTLGEILAESGLPDGAFSILPSPRKVADRLITDDRFRLISFTGSPQVGWDLKNRAGKKKVVLELGGNAACIIAPDADREDATKRLLVGAFSYAGQSCISVQRIFIHDSIYESFKDELVGAVKGLTVGDPKRESTDVGPLISEEEAIRVEKAMAAAVSKGARLLTGGKRSGAVLTPALLENVPVDDPIACEEAFGPLAVLSRYRKLDDAVDQVNASRFGLQTGLFTKSLPDALRAWNDLEVGGVIVGDIPSWRVDHMPYGGVKDSGFGREGIRFAMEDMSEIRLLVLRGAL